MKKVLIILVILVILVGVGGFLAFKIFMGGLEGKGIGGRIFKKIENLIKEKVGEYEEEEKEVVEEEETKEQGEETGGGGEIDIMSKKIEDVSQKEMIEYCQQQSNITALETPIYLKDTCFYQAAVHFRNSELCNSIEVADNKKECLGAAKDFSEKWNAMQGKIGKMNEALCVEIGAQIQCHQLKGMSDFEAYQKWLDEWSKWLNDEFGVTAEEYKLYSDMMSDDNLWAMNVGMRMIERVGEVCPEY